MTERPSRPPTEDALADRSPRPACGVEHPLFEDIRCQRLRGHPDAHRAPIGEGAGLLEWPTREQKAS